MARVPLPGVQCLETYLQSALMFAVRLSAHVDMYQPLCSEQSVLKLEGFAEDVYIVLCNVYYLGNLLGS